MSRQNLARNRSRRLLVSALVLLTLRQAAAFADAPQPPTDGVLPAPPAASMPVAAPLAPPAAAPIAAPVTTSPQPAPAVEQGDAMRNLEQRVGDLKEQVFRAKARLSLLSERFLRSTAGGGRAVIVHQNQMGRLFQPLRVTYQLDGRELITKTLDATTAQAPELAIWDGGLKPGDHTLSVSIVYRGSATPVFGYFNQYTYTANAAQRFSANDGGTTRIRVSCKEKGNPALTQLVDRPFIEFQVDDGVSPSASSVAQASVVNQAQAAPHSEDKSSVRKGP